MKQYSNIYSLLMMGSSLAAAHAATLNLTSDFESDRDGWVHPVNSPNQTMVQSDGPFNQVLYVSSSGGSSAGSRLVVPNDSTAWIGDYTAAGITAVEMDLVNNSSSTLMMRLGIEGGGPGNRWTSSSPVTLNSSDRGRFRLEFSDLSSAGGNDLSAALANVSQIRILHTTSTGEWKGDNVSASFIVDNITLVPEPSSLAFFLITAATLLPLRRRNT
ncbi:MAG: hypothetical protein ACPG32_07655 [Akkermansiaceae bacterium]